MVNSRLSPQIFAVVSATLSSVSNGFHFGWLSPTLAELLAEDSDIPITSDQGSWIANFLQIGCICGSLVAILLVDKLGRKTTLLLTAAPQFVACLLIIFSTNYWWFYTARFIAGITIGTVFTILPMYIGEIADDRMRGGLGIMIIVMTNLGQLIPYSVGPWVSRATLGAIGAVISIIYVLTFAWAPESPYYYAMKSAPYKIQKSLAWLRGKSDVGDEVLIIQKNVMLNHSNKGSIANLFRVKANLKALGILITVVSCQQLSGNPAISAYSTVIFDQVDSGISSSISVIIIGIVSFGAGIAAVFVAGKIGKRPLILTCMSLAIVCILGEAVYFHLQASNADIESISWLPLVAMIGFLLSFAIGIAPLSIAMSSELFHCEVKASANTIGTIYYYGSSVVATKFYQVTADAYGIHVAFYAFGATSVVLMILTFFIVPETKGRSLGEIQDILRGSSKTAL